MEPPVDYDEGVRLVRDNIGTLSFYLPRARREKVERPGVVLVQGFGVSGRAMMEIERFLEAFGHRCRVAPLGGLLGYLQTSNIRKSGGRLERYLLGLPDGCRPWIIGHSMGGILARHVVQETPALARVRGVITIGTPHQGTPTAILGLMLGLGLVSRAPLSITPYSRTIKRLNETPWPAGLPLLSITSKADPMCVRPFGRLPFEKQQGIREMELRKLGHTELLRDPAVLGAIAQTLMRGTTSSM